LTLWEKDILLCATAEAGCLQQASVIESKQFDIPSRSRLMVLQNYSEQPVSKSIQITGTAGNYSMRQTSQLRVCGTDFGI
jgi:hypothetical protein